MRLALKSTVSSKWACSTRASFTFETDEKSRGALFVFWLIDGAAATRFNSCGCDALTKRGTCFLPRLRRRSDEHTAGLSWKARLLRSMCRADLARSARRRDNNFAAAQEGQKFLKSPRPETE